MSEVPGQEGAPLAGAGPSPGAMLRQAREAAGLHVAAMAVAMKVPVAKLEALEQDRYDLLPDAVFARALASTVCRTLKIDPRPILDRLPQTAAPRLVDDSDGLNAPFRGPRDAVTPGWREQLTRPVSVIVGALLLGAVVVVLLPRTRFEDSVATAATTASTAMPPAPPSGTAAPPAQPSSPIVPASMTQPLPAPANAAPQAAPATAQAAAASGADAIVFRASAQSWVEVRDAKGAVPLRKVLAGGESATVSGAMPLQVVVGNVQGTEVAVRGKPYDLKPLARDNVARFEIK